MGQVLPLFFGVAFVPPLIKVLGEERFAILSIAWTLIGVFTLFDLGLGRAVTHATSIVLGKDSKEEINKIVSSGVLSAGMIGAIVGLGAWIGAPFYVAHLKSNHVSYSETLLSVRAIAVGIPLVTAMSGVRGYLESVSRFKFINSYRIVIGVGSFVFPLLLARATQNVGFGVVSLVFLRLIALLHHWYYAEKQSAIRISMAAFSRNELVKMLGFGGWMTVSSVVGSMMVYFDRFIIGSFVGLGAVTYYIVPVDILVKFLVIPNAIVGALFPIATEALFSGSREVRAIYHRSLAWIVVVGLPLMVVGVLFSPWALRIWLGVEFAKNASFVARVITVGVMASAVSLVPFSMIQAAGFPNRTAILHLIEIPIYMTLMFVFLRSGGIRFAAVMWTVRAVVDALLLFLMWFKLQPRFQGLPLAGEVS